MEVQFREMLEEEFRIFFENLYKNLPGSTYIPSKKHRLQNEIYDEVHDENAFGGFLDFVDKYEKYMS